MTKFGPAGNSLSFYDDGNKHTEQAAEWLSKKGLTAYEYSFGRGVRMTKETAEKIGTAFAAQNIEVSVHAPYFINLANPDEDMIEKSFGYITQSLTKCNELGGKRVVVHTAACGKCERAVAVDRAKRRLEQLCEILDRDYKFDFLVCLETMGKLNQIGTVEEIIDFCRLSEKFCPCFDFGHINSYMRGGLKTKDDFRRVLDYAVDGIGYDRAKNMHVHFSHIQYADKGEIKHLTFQDTKYGPFFEPLAELFVEYGFTPYVICESDGTMAEDALTMKTIYENVLQNQGSVL